MESWGGVGVVGPGAACQSSQLLERLKVEDQMFKKS